ncbi:MAG: FAD-dependent oxidoreductase, partial [Clostridia bacterium]
KDVSVMRGDEVFTCKADNIIVATGAAENALPFEGWTLPGVMGAGAAQTLMNLHGVMPGKRVLMMGSGNVGLVVAMQLKQVGCEVVAIVDAAPRIGGYGVHAAKLARTGIPFYIGHTIVRAEGEEFVKHAVIGEVDKSWQVIPGTEKTFDVDTICIAVGLSPMYQLDKMAGCNVKDERLKGGMHAVVNQYGETDKPGIFAAGDVTGIEEASSAMISGRIAGAAVAARAGYITKEEHGRRHEEYRASLMRLRQGMFAGENKGNPNVAETAEGIPLSSSLLIKGYLQDDEIQRFPGYTKNTSGFHPVVECTQNIPCNPCQDACPNGCIYVGNDISSLPQIRAQKTCSACGMCVSACPGQAIFLVNEAYAPGYAAVVLPYEFFPVPEVGQKGYALNRGGDRVCEAEVV